MPISYTDRGFATYAEFDDLYGARITVRQSSLAGTDAVWIFSQSDRDDYKVDGSAHLDLEHAKVVVAALQEWIASVEN